MVILRIHTELCICMPNVYLYIYIYIYACVCVSCTQTSQPRQWNSLPPALLTKMPNTRHYLQRNLIWFLGFMVVVMVVLVLQGVWGRTQDQSNNCLVQNKWHAAVKYASICGYISKWVLYTEKLYSEDNHIWHHLKIVILSMIPRIL